MINKLQELKGRTKLKIYKNISNYYTEMKNKNFQTNNQDPCAKNAQSTRKIYHEVFLLMKFLQTKVKNMNINYFDLYNTDIKTRDENRDIDNQYEDDDKDYIDINPNHYVGIKIDNVMLR